MRRVAVIGCGGAGKSTFACDLAERLDLPLVHLDEYYWAPGWRPAQPGAWSAAQRQLVAGDRWVVDGNYLATLDVRLSAADTVVFLDLPRWRCAWRATWRVLAAHGRANTAPGCPERVGWRHLRFLSYVWRYPKDARPRVLERLTTHAESTEIVRLRTPAQVRRFLRSSGNRLT